MTSIASLSPVDLAEKFVNHGQGHIFNHITGFDENHLIYPQLLKFDVADSVDHFQSAQKVATGKPGSFLPVKTVVDSRNCDNTYINLVNETFYKSLCGGELGVVIMSGGQGTRLGFPGPKGMYNLNLISQKTIFQIHIERVLKVKRLEYEKSGIDVKIPIYIMTSDLNHQIIVDYFSSVSFFGYPEEDIIFFEQGVEPSFTFDGKIILESPTKMSLAPDGNGGIYLALKRNGCFNDMKKRGVKHLHVYGIDNVLTQSLDPFFLGVCIEKSVECGNKVCWRAEKSEKVGVTAELDGKMHILEYSEIPSDLAEVEDNNGKLLFGAANICNHYLNVDFLVEKVLPNLSNIYHFAKKKIPFWDAKSNQTITPKDPNGIKLELFIFDVFPYADRWTVVEVERENEFAPVKNQPGHPSDSPDTARRLLTLRSIGWLKKAGAVVKMKGSTEINEYDDNFQCEISPLLSVAGEGLESFAGKEINLPCYLE